MNTKEFFTHFNTTETSTAPEQLQNVMTILEKVRKYKDQALFEYTEEFDGEQLNNIKVPEKYLKDSYESLDSKTKQALETIKKRIAKYEKQIKYKDKDLDEFKYIYRPLEKVGIYVPGGTALYPSSVLMSVIPAQVAGVREIHVTTPLFTQNNITFATLYLAGVKSVYTVGGAQAIGALAYGTETIPKVDKIVGPGNAFVALAKRLVFGDVGIDSIAGPSELLLYVDDSANIEHIAYDIFAQSEHDANARTFLLSESQTVINQVEEKIKAMIGEQPRATIIRKSITHNHYPVADNREDLLKVINYIAPEHVSIQHKEQDDIAQNINFAGAIFTGDYSPEAVGDYIAGPSHVLPTNRTARYSHGLNVNDFQTSHAVISLKETTYQNIVSHAETIAEKEGLFAHKNSLTVRKKNEKEEM